MRGGLGGMWSIHKGSYSLESASLHRLLGAFQGVCFLCLGTTLKVASRTKSFTTLKITQRYICSSVCVGEWGGSGEKSLRSFMFNKLPCTFSYNPHLSSKILELLERCLLGAFQGVCFLFCRFGLVLTHEQCS